MIEPKETQSRPKSRIAVMKGSSLQNKENLCLNINVAQKGNLKVVTDKQATSTRKTLIVKNESAGNVPGKTAPKQARSAPDFKKLHKNWESKLAKKKASTKRPNTKIEPFNLTKTTPSKKKENIGVDNDILGDSCDELSDSEFQDNDLRPPRRYWEVTSDKQTSAKEKRGKDSGYNDVAAELAMICVTDSRSSVKKEKVRTDEIKDLFNFKPDSAALESILNNNGVDESKIRSTPDRKNSNYSYFSPSPFKQKRTSIYYTGPRPDLPLSGFERRLMMRRTSAMDSGRTNQVDFQPSQTLVGFREIGDKFSVTPQKASEANEVSWADTLKCYSQLPTSNARSTSPQRRTQGELCDEQDDGDLQKNGLNGDYDLSRRSLDEVFSRHLEERGGQDCTRENAESKTVMTPVGTHEFKIPKSCVGGSSLSVKKKRLQSNQVEDLFTFKPDSAALESILNNNGVDENNIRSTPNTRNTNYSYFSPSPFKQKRTSVYYTGPRPDRPLSGFERRLMMHRASAMTHERETKRDEFQPSKTLVGFQEIGDKFSVTPQKESPSVVRRSCSPTIPKEPFLYNSDDDCCCNVVPANEVSWADTLKYYSQLPTRNAQSTSSHNTTEDTEALVAQLENEVYQTLADMKLADENPKSAPEHPPGSDFSSYKTNTEYVRESNRCSRLEERNEHPPWSEMKTELLPGSGDCLPLQERSENPSVHRKLFSPPSCDTIDDRDCRNLREAGASKPSCSNATSAENTPLYHNKIVKDDPLLSEGLTCVQAANEEPSVRVGTSERVQMVNSVSFSPFVPRDEGPFLSENVPGFSTFKSSKTERGLSNKGTDGVLSGQWPNASSVLTTTPMFVSEFTRERYVVDSSKTFARANLPTEVAAPTPQLNIQSLFRPYTKHVDRDERFTVSSISLNGPVCEQMDRESETNTRHPLSVLTRLSSSDSKMSGLPSTDVGSTTVVRASPWPEVAAPTPRRQQTNFPQCQTTCGAENCNVSTPVNEQPANREFQIQAVKQSSAFTRVQPLSTVVDEETLDAPKSFDGANIRPDILTPTPHRSGAFKELGVRSDTLNEGVSRFVSRHHQIMRDALVKSRDYAQEILLDAEVSLYARNIKHLRESGVMQRLENPLATSFLKGDDLSGLFTKPPAQLSTPKPGQLTVEQVAKFFEEEFSDLWSSERLLNVIEQFIGPDIAGHPVWNLRTKTPKNEQVNVPWHQDSAYLTPEACEVLQPTAWIPLLDTNKENGCMQVARYGHRSGVLAKYTCCAGPTWYVDLDENEMKKTLGVDLEKDIVICEVPFGGVLFINNMIPHRSLNNVSDKVRWSLDLRWQVPDKPDGFYGLKENILLRTSNDPGYVINWKEFALLDRNKLQDQHVNAKTKVDKENYVDDPEFDTTIGGPWMDRWEIVHHNKHTLAFEKAANNETSWYKA